MKKFEKRVDREIKQYEEYPPIEKSVEALDWWSGKSFQHYHAWPVSNYAFVTLVCLQKGFLVMVVTL